MDGNRRWAKAKALPAFEGHRAGYEALKKLSKDFGMLRKKYGLEEVALYAFSTENWDRAADEVSFLMNLFELGLKEVLKTFNADKPSDEKIRIRVAGQRERFSPSLQKLIQDAEEDSKHFTGGTVTFCLSYGGRAEITDAVSALMRDGVKKVTEEEIEKRLWTAGMSDPDIIIRTSGEYRLSNFLTWKGVYSELFFIEKHWPDFTTADLEKIFAEYEERDRRIGK